jgi:PAS domain S-box-containing protein
MAQIINVTDQSKKSRINFLVWLPIPIFLFLIVILGLFRFGVVWNPVFLFSALNIIFLAIIMFFVSILAVRSYLAEKSLLILFLGSGTLALGIGALVAGLEILGSNVNNTVTIYNTMACISSIFIVGSIISGIKLISIRLKSNWPFILSYLLVFVLVVGLAFLVQNHFWPVYFVQGKGPTITDLAVLYVTITLFAISALILLIHNLKERLNFNIWYGLGLGLIAIGLIGVSVQTSVGDPLNWIGRISQYLGAVYILIAIIVSFRETGIWILPWQQTLIETETRYKRIVETANEGIMISDTKGLIKFVNPKMVKMLGYSNEEILGKPIQYFIDPSYHDKKLKDIHDMGEDLDELYEIKFIRKDGSDLWAHVSATANYDYKGQQIGYLEMFSDITRRKRAEEALEKSERNLADAQRIGHIGSWKWNIQTGELDWSDELYSIYGVDFHTFTPTMDSFANFIHPDDKETINNILNQISEDKSVEFDFRIITEQNSTRILRTIAKITSHDEDGNPLIITGINQDVTEKKKAEEKLQELIESGKKLTAELKVSNEELINTQYKLKETINKLEISNKELEQFAYVASHDLQEPLRMVASFTQLLERRYKEKLDEDADDYIGFIVEGANRMKDLIDDLLAFSRLNTEKKEFESTDLNQILENVLSNLKSTIEEEDAHITNDKLPVINCDSSQISQVFQNLISNSIKFHQTPPRIHISVEENDNEWILEVNDEGIGIDTENQQKIFDVFSRLHTRDEFEGTGIGLSICKRIVERHGGRIWVKSETGKGSTFYFTIPKT